MKYAQVRDGKVVQVFFHDPVFQDRPLSDLFPQDMVERMVQIRTNQSVDVGWVYENNQFSPPDQTGDVQQVRIRRISPLSFRRRLDPGTRQLITLAASRGLENGEAGLQVFLDDLSSSSFVDLDDADVMNGVQILRTSKLITEEQAAAMLADGTMDEAI